MASAKTQQCTRLSLAMVALCTIVAAPRDVCADDAVQLVATATAPSGEARLETWLNARAKKHKKPKPKRDPAFERYVDMGLLARAWKTLDPKTMTDVALQFAHAERTLYRSHPSITSEMLLDVAMRVASQQGDTKTLARLSRVAEENGNSQLASQAAGAAKLSGGVRSAANTLSATTTSPKQLAAFQALQRRIQRAAATYNQGELQRLDTIISFTALDEAQQAQARNLVREAIKTVPDAKPEYASSIALLSSVARAGRGGQIGWPDASVPDSPTPAPAPIPGAPGPVPRQPSSPAPTRPTPQRSVLDGLWLESTEDNSYFVHQVAGSRLIVRAYSDDDELTATHQATIRTSGNPAEPSGLSISVSGELLGTFDLDWEQPARQFMAECKGAPDDQCWWVRLAPGTRVEVFWREDWHEAQILRLNRDLTVRVTVLGADRRWDQDVKLSDVMEN